MSYTAEPELFFFTDKKFWITGATSGIGLALTEQLLQQNAFVIASGRKLQRLRELKLKYDRNLYLLPLDVTQPDQLLQAKKLLPTITHVLDGAIFSAGISEHARFQMDRFQPEFFRKIFETNYFGVLECFAIALPFLKRAIDSHVAILSSSITFFPTPTMGAYGSSKCALEYTFRAIQQELFAEDSHNGLHISLVKPGFVDTPMTLKNRFAMPGKISATQAAKIILTGLFDQKQIITFPFFWTRLAALAGCLPNSIQCWLSRWFFQKYLIPTDKPSSNLKN